MFFKGASAIITSMLKKVFAAFMVMAILLPWVNGAALAFAGCNDKACMLKARNHAHGKSCRVAHAKERGGNGRENHHGHHNGGKTKPCHDEDAGLECEKNRGDSTSIDRFEEDPFVPTSANTPAYGAGQQFDLTGPPCYTGPSLVLPEKPPNAFSA